MLPWVAYVAPMATFMLITTLEGLWPGAYPWLYGVKVIVVSILLGILARPWQDVRPGGKVTVTAIAVGLIVFAEWILLDQWIPYPHLGERVGYNPFVSLTGWALPIFFGLSLLWLGGDGAHYGGDLLAFFPSAVLERTRVSENPGGHLYLGSLCYLLCAFRTPP